VFSHGVNGAVEATALLNYSLIRRSPAEGLRGLSTDYADDADCFRAVRIFTWSKWSSGGNCVAGNDGVFSHVEIVASVGNCVA